MRVNVPGMGKWKAWARAYAAGLALAVTVVGSTPSARPAPTYAIVRVRVRAARFDPLEVIGPGTVLTTTLQADGDPPRSSAFGLN
jgi:hypothetical protein